MLDFIVITNYISHKPLQHRWDSFPYEGHLFQVCSVCCRPSSVLMLMEADAPVGGHL